MCSYVFIRGWTSSYNLAHFPCSTLAPFPYPSSPSHSPFPSQTVVEGETAEFREQEEQSSPQSGGALLFGSSGFCPCVDAVAHLEFRDYTTLKCMPLQERGLYRICALRLNYSIMLKLQDHFYNFLWEIKCEVRKKPSQNKTIYMTVGIPKVIKCNKIHFSAQYHLLIHFSFIVGFYINWSLVASWDGYW